MGHLSTANRTPVTILTGFLGAGKTTLLNRILSEPHGHRIAVIENEFGPEGVDGEILVSQEGEQIIEMNNGCLCCTIRGDLARILTALGDRRRDGEIDFERVIIETTGMADPGPVVQTFFLDPQIADRYVLDGVITIVDALHGAATLDAQPEAQAQVGFADRLLLSKTDLVRPQQVDALTQRLVRINPRATIATARFGIAPIAELLAIGGFDLDTAMNIDPGFLEAEDAGHHHSHHADEIKAFVYTADKPFNAVRLEQLIAALAEGYGPDLLRYKGVLWVEGIPHRVILQGVQWVASSVAGRKWESDVVRSSKLVFIGRDMHREVIVDSLGRCLFDAPDSAAVMRESGIQRVAEF